MVGWIDVDMNVSYRMVDGLQVFYRDYQSNARSVADTQGFPILARMGIAKGTSPLPEREVSSQPPLLPAAAGGTRRALESPEG